MAISIITADVTANQDIAFSLVGDGSATSCVFDLAEAPFNIDFKGNLPSAIWSANYMANGFTAPTTTTTLSGGRLSFSFSSALPLATHSNGETLDGTVVLQYNGVS